LFGDLLNVLYNIVVTGSFISVIKSGNTMESPTPKANNVPPMGLRNGKALNIIPNGTKTIIPNIYYKRH